MITGVCGMNCGDCESYGKQCKGCRAENGEVFWRQRLGEKICSICLCARSKQLKGCGACEEMPCALYRRIHDPALTEDEQLGRLCAQMQRLRQAQ